MHWLRYVFDCARCELSVVEGHPERLDLDPPFCYTVRFRTICCIKLSPFVPVSVLLSCVQPAGRKFLKSDEIRYIDVFLAHFESHCTDKGIERSNLGYLTVGCVPLYCSSLFDNSINHLCSTLLILCIRTSTMWRHYISIINFNVDTESRLY